jgi:hypothetical protein
MKAAGVTKLLIELTNNRGGFVCLGQFLHQYFAGSDFGYPCVSKMTSATTSYSHTDTAVSRAPFVQILLRRRSSLRKSPVARARSTFLQTASHVSIL